MAKTASYSELSALRQCALKHQLQWKERWRPEVETSKALVLGGVWHSMLEVWYTEIQKAQQHGGAVLENELKTKIMVEVMDDLEEDDFDQLRWMLEGYVECWETDPEWEILDIERKEEVPLLLANGAESGIRLKMKADLVIKDHGASESVWIVDHKSAKGLRKGKAEALDDQLGLYTLALERVGVDVHGSILSESRKDKLQREMKHEERFRRKRTTRSEGELKEIEREAVEQLLEGAKERETQAPRSPDPVMCAWKCPFLEPCLANRGGYPMKEALTDYGFVVDTKRH